MAEYINRNELVGNLDKFAPEHLTPLIRTLIEKQPTADVAEVVRCRDCKHYCLSDFRKPEEHRWCEQICNGDYYPEPTDFCSYGERKDDK